MAGVLTKYWPLKDLGQYLVNKFLAINFLGIVVTAYIFLNDFKNMRSIMFSL